VTLLPCTRAHRLEGSRTNQPWLIESLWSDQAVGVLGGEPKTCKSFLALDMAVSVASGTPCLRRYLPKRTGRVLLYAAEDAPHVVKQRLEGICRAAQVRLEQLEIHVITAPTLRLDDQADRSALTSTLDHLRPTLLVLDPFVRLHRIDENASSEVAPLLGYLRELQRRFQTAVVLVHHARKGAHRSRPGQALRGSSEFHAWGDSNLYLRRRDNDLRLSVEHRAAPSLEDLPLVLKSEANELALEVLDTLSPPENTSPQSSSASERIHEVLKRASEPLSLAELRQACRIRTQRLCDALRQLQQEDRVRKTRHGYELASKSHDPVSPAPAPLDLEGKGNGKPSDPNCTNQ